MSFLEKVILGSRPLSEVLRALRGVVFAINTYRVYFLWEELDSPQNETFRNGVDGLLGTLLEHPREKMVRAIMSK